MQPHRGALSIAVALSAALMACGTDPPEPSAIAVIGDITSGTTVEAARDDVEVVRELGSDTVLDHIFTGQKMYVLGLENDVEGRTWLRVQTPGSFGWILHDADDPPLRPSEPACPEGDSSRTVDVEALVPLTPWERLLCLDGLTLSASPVLVAELPSDSLYGGSPEWLADEPSLHLYGPSATEGPGIAVHVDSAGDVRLDDGQWYAVQLRVNDAAAATCVRELILDELGIENPEQVALELAPVTASDSVLWCREQFVVTAAEPVAAPAPVAEPRSPPSGGSWSAIPAAPLAGRDSHGAVWTGEELLVWGGFATTGEDYNFVAAADGAAFDPDASTWRRIAASPLKGRVDPVMVWTGAEALIFGGMTGGFEVPFEPVTDGAAYDPAHDRWRTLAPIPPPFANSPAVAWTGEELVIAAADGQVAAYRPIVDEWELLPEAPMPEDLWAVGMTWTGTQVVVVGYPEGVSSRAGGAAWDPTMRSWRELPESPIMALNAVTAPIWTGTEMIVFSRSLPDEAPDGVPLDTTYGSFYDPASNRWRVAAIQDVYLPTGRAALLGDLVVSLNAVYDIAADEWLEPPRRPDGEWGAPIATDSEVLFWGGGPGGDMLSRFDGGLRYRPDDD